MGRVILNRTNHEPLKNRLHIETVCNKFQTGMNRKSLRFPKKYDRLMEQMAGTGPGNRKPGHTFVAILLKFKPNINNKYMK